MLSFSVDFSLSVWVRGGGSVNRTCLLDAGFPSSNLLMVTSSFFFLLDIFRMKFITRKGNDTILLKNGFLYFPVSKCKMTCNFSKKSVLLR